MKVQIWHSFACNNSASFYLVARFESERIASDCATELREYIAANDAELRAMSTRERRANRELTFARLEFADRTGIDWPEDITSGYADDVDIEIVAVGDAVTIYHDYCLGFEDALPGYLAARGASIDEQRVNALPTVGVLVHRANDADVDALAARLDDFFAALPTAGDAALDPAVTFRSPSVTGYLASLEMSLLGELRTILAAGGGADIEVSIDRADERRRFETIAGARCPECDRAELDFIASSRSDAPDDQLACRGCGGMFEIEMLAASMA